MSHYDLICLHLVLLGIALVCLLASVVRSNNVALVASIIAMVFLTANLFRLSRHQRRKR